LVNLGKKPIGNVRFLIKRKTILRLKHTFSLIMHKKTAPRDVFVLQADSFNKITVSNWWDRYANELKYL